jgi:hypothetical protein
MISSIVKIWSLLLICNAKQTLGKDAFALLWKFPDKTDPAWLSQCGPVFQEVRDSIYPSFVEEVVLQTDITVQEVTTLDPDWNKTRGRGPPRRMLDFDNSNRTSMRQLRSSCNWMICDDSVYIIRVAGCTTWCLRNGRRLRGLGDKVIKVKDYKEKDEKLKLKGTRHKLLKDQVGTDSAVAVYNAIEALPLCNPCRLMLLTLQYGIKIVDFDFLKCD